MINKKAQSDIAFFAAFLIGLVIIAPVLLMIIRTSIGGFSEGLQAAGYNYSANTVATIQESFTNFYDFLIIATMVAAIVVLIITSFLVNVHPVFILFYIIECFVSMLIMSQLVNTANTVWLNDKIAPMSIYLPATQFVMEYYGLVLLAVMILTGIIMYSKLNSGGQRGSP